MFKPLKNKNGFHLLEAALLLGREGFTEFELFQRPIGIYKSLQYAQTTRTSSGTMLNLMTKRQTDSRMDAITR